MELYRHSELPENYATYNGETETYYVDPETGKKKIRTKKKLSGGERMGETEHWDEFRAHDNITGELKNEVAKGARIMFGKTWDYLIAMNNYTASFMTLPEVAANSKDGRLFDRKRDKHSAPYGENEGRLLNGKFATARSAGNYLAGLNAASGKLFGRHISRTTNMKLAGAVHKKKASEFNLTRIYLFGKSFGPAPYYGEIPYAGRRIDAGFKAGQAQRESKK